MLCKKFIRSRTLKYISQLKYDFILFFYKKNLFLSCLAILLEIRAILGSFIPRICSVIILNPISSSLTFFQNYGIWRLDISSSQTYMIFHMFLWILDVHLPLRNTMEFVILHYCAGNCKLQKNMTILLYSKVYPII